MKRTTGVVLALAIVFACAVSASATSTCIDGGVFKTCNERIELGKPIHFKLVGSRPAGVTADEATLAATLAALEWNRHWPALPHPTCGAVCFDGKGSAGVGPNGFSTISWGATTQCGGADPDGVAVACVYSNADRRITEVDVILNSSKTWRAPIADATGEVAGAVPNAGGDWYDVQSALTHEFGHAIGLEDIGAARPWPYDLTDTVRYQQTMYGFYYKGSTNKRTLDAGDIAGLQVVAAHVLLDR